ncbi:MAG TPA: sulfatase [bacterium]|nr:sulfatase [bacterium]
MAAQPDQRTLTRHTGSRALLAALVAAATLPGCGGDDPARSVLLVTLDTTRADWTGCYGRPDVRTPWLDRVARGGTQFAQAVADVPVTLPSHTTLMTGIPALGHGVRYNADFRVGPDARTLAEALHEDGWATGAVVSTLVLDSGFGLDQGFDHYDDDLTPGYVMHDDSLYPQDRTQWLPRADRRADETADRALEWLRGAAAPFLCWVHFYDAHFPFDPPPPWGRAASHLYGAEIQFADRQLGRLVRWLDDSGPPGAVLAVTADHGEGLDQHREDGHGIFVYDETVRVPLAVRAADVPAGRLAAGQVRTVDVAPTLLELAGRPARFGTGTSLVPLMRGASPERNAPAYLESIKSRLFYGGTGLKAVRTPDAKYIWAPHPELYDLRRDPGETNNLAETDPARAEAMQSELLAAMRTILEETHPVSETTELDEETAARLRSLGYASGGEGAGRGTLEEELALRGHDPKDLVDVSMAAREIENGFLENGERKLQRFFATARRPEDDPRMTRLWAAAHLNAAKLRFDARDFAGAADHYGAAVAIDPEYAQARWRWIYALNLAGRADVAAMEGAALLKAYPLASRVRLHTGLALALQDRRRDARAELEAVADGDRTPEDVARQARWYLDRVGSPDEHRALARYRGAE